MFQTCSNRLSVITTQARINRLLLLSSLVLPVARVQGGEPTTICHIPPGNHENPQSITVSAAALAAHLGHGDHLGPCAPVCAANGAACASDAECCSSHCGQGICDSSCAANGNDCSDSPECCSGYCANGLCATPCAANGAACSAPDQCCGNSCQDGVCVPPCSVNGDACSASSQCCSGQCVSGTCSPACTGNGGGCAWSDECCSGICSAEGICTEQCTIGPEFEGPYCNSSLPCCPGSGVCIFGACYEGEVCQMLGEACDNVNFTLWCCFEYNCVDGVCVPGCASAGESCSNGEFGPYCCAGLTCFENVCVAH